jgi:hypothetical protein
MELFIHQKKKTKNTCYEVLIAIVMCYSWGEKGIIQGKIIGVKMVPIDKLFVQAVVV